MINAVLQGFIDSEKNWLDNNDAGISLVLQESEPLTMLVIAWRRAPVQPIPDAAARIPVAPRDVQWRWLWSQFNVDKKEWLSLAGLPASAQNLEKADRAINLKLVMPDGTIHPRLYLWLEAKELLVFQMLKALIQDKTDKTGEEPNKPPPPSQPKTPKKK